MRALGFCVGVDHAASWRAVFTEAGIPSQAVSGDNPASGPGARLSDWRCARKHQYSVRRRPIQRGRSTCRRSTRSCSSDRRRAPRSSCSSWAEGFGDSGQGSPHGPRLCRAPPQGVPVRHQTARAYGADPAGPDREIEAASLSSPRAARSSWISSRSRSCWRTSGRRWPTGGRRSGGTPVIWRSGPTRLSPGVRRRAFGCAS